MKLDLEQLVVTLQRARRLLLNPQEVHPGNITLVIKDLDLAIEQIHEELE